MQKVLGSVLVIGASSAIGYLQGINYQRYGRELQILERLFLMLRSEIQYANTPLREAFLHIGKKVEGLYGQWFIELSKSLEERTGTTFFALWKDSIDGQLGEAMLKERDIQSLKLIGTNMGCMDKTLQLGAIDLYLSELQVRIQEVRQSIAEKRKLCNCLGVMGGIFLVIVLI